MEEVDPFPFQLARDLGMTLSDLDERMGYDEYLRWRAFYHYEAWQQEQAAVRAKALEKDRARR